MIEALLGLVPEASHTSLEELFSEPLEDLASLRDGVRAYTAGVRAMARLDPQVDEATATTISGICEALLTRAEGQDERVHRLVQVACHYYVLSFDEDDDGDLGVDGFSDDLQVAEAVQRLI